MPLTRDELLRGLRWSYLLGPLALQSVDVPAQSGLPGIRLWQFAVSLGTWRVLWQVQRSA